MMRILLVIASVIMGLTVTPIFACEMRIGYENEPPFHFRNADDLVIGTDADLVRNTLAAFGCKASFIEHPWPRTLVSIEEGSLDMAMGASFKANRAEWAYYSIPYKFIEHNLFTNTDKTQQVSGVEDFLSSGNRLGVVNGWAYPVEIRDLVENPVYSDVVVKVTGFEKLPMMLERSHVEGIIANPKTLQALLEDMESGHKFSSRASYQEELHFLFSKKTAKPQMILDFNNTLYRLIYNGTRYRIFNKYLKK